MSKIINIHSKLPQPKYEDDLIDLAKRHGVEEVHIKIDPARQLHAIIAIHSTKLGPALGGCRCISYTSMNEAFLDAARLAKSMSYKAAISGLAYGGGKAVLIKPDSINDRTEYFKAFGRFIEELGGRYITAVDAGTSVTDMDAISLETKHVCSTSNRKDNGDPSPYTALGVLKGIQAAVKHKFQRSDLEGMRVAIQGIGHVGYELAKLLIEYGVDLYICEINKDSLEKCADEFQCSIISPSKIYTSEYDIYAPCALGGTINSYTVENLRCAIVAGAANNQLFENHHADKLHDKGILYAPDYVINAGGIIHIASKNEADTLENIDHIYYLLQNLFRQAKQLNFSPSRVADQTAEQILYRNQSEQAV